jgi:hypothetical protein
MQASTTDVLGEPRLVLDHIATVVRPALRKYLAAERVLTDALRSKDPDTIATARQDVMLMARLAAWVLHHLSDLVLTEPSPTLTFAEIGEVRSAVEARCVFLRTGKPVADVGLLRDVADAFKHHRPDRPSTMVLVSTDVIPVGSGYSQMRFGEGKYGGGEQVVITTKDGDKRALSSVLQNVFDAWRACSGSRCRRSTSINVGAALCGCQSNVCCIGSSKKQRLTELCCKTDARWRLRRLVLEGWLVMTKLSRAVIACISATTMLAGAASIARADTSLLGGVY